MDEAALAALAAPLVGVPFIEHGRDPTGWDCWGLARWMGEATGMGCWPSYGEAYARADGRDGERQVGDAIAAHLGNWHRLPRPKACSIILFRKFGRAVHVGFALNRHSMIHVTRGMAGGTTIERFDTLVWGHLMDGAWRPGEGA